MGFEFLFFLNFIGCFLFSNFSHLDAEKIGEREGKEFDKSRIFLDLFCFKGMKQTILPHFLFIRLKFFVLLIRRCENTARLLFGLRENGEILLFFLFHCLFDNFEFILCILKCYVHFLVY